jgi:hypothetical protein
MSALFCGQLNNAIGIEDHVVLNDGMMMNSKELRTGDSLIMILSQNLPGRTEEHTENNLVMIASVTARIQSMHIPTQTFLM